MSAKKAGGNVTTHTQHEIVYFCIIYEPYRRGRAAGARYGYIALCHVVKRLSN